MMLTILLCSIIVVQAKVNPDNPDECNGVIINDVYYEKENITPLHVLPFFLDVDLDSDDVYTSYWLETAKFGLAKINLNTKVLTPIPEVDNGITYAIDHDAKEIFVGKEGGIFKYDFRSNSTTFYAATEGIRQMYYKKSLYFTSLLDQKMHVCKDGLCSVFEPLKDSKVLLFVVDNDNTVYFTNTSGLFEQKLADTKVLKAESKNLVTALAIDPSGQLYASINGDVYAVNVKDVQFEKLFKHFFGSRLTFDKAGHFIYADWGGVYRYLPNGNKTSQCKDVISF